MRTADFYYDLPQELSRTGSIGRPFFLQTDATWTKRPEHWSIQILNIL